MPWRNKSAGDNILFFYELSLRRQTELADKKAS